MKTQSIALAAINILTILSFSSCSVDDDFSDLEQTQEQTQEKTQARIAEKQDEIVFQVKTDVNARAGGNGLRQFKITAYEGGDNYYGGATDVVTSFDNGISWSSDHIRYWPGNRPSGWNGLTFYAYTVGYSGNRAVSGDEESSVLDLGDKIPMIKDFKVKSDVYDQRDLMYAVAKDISKNDGNGEVSLDFKHALCKVNFTLSNQNPKLSNIRILDIELGGVKGVGSYIFPDVSAQKGGDYFHHRWPIQGQMGNPGRCG